MGIVRKLRFKASSLYYFNEKGKGKPEDVIEFLDNHENLYRTKRTWTFKNTTRGVILDLEQKELEVYYPQFGGLDKKEFEKGLAKYGWS